MRSIRNVAQQIAKFLIIAINVWISIAEAAKISKSDYKLVCYYANWAIYRPGFAKFTPENINPFLCTHVIYAFAGMNKHYELKPFDSYNDIQLGNYNKFVNLRTYNPKLKLMIAVGGWNEGSKRFSKLVESSSSRERFVKSALSFLRKHGFDGLDLDWEYPGFRDGGQDDDKQGYAKLVKELREAFDSENVPNGKSKLLLTMAVPAGQQYIDKGYDVPVLSKNLDFFNMLTYDYHTAHEALINHHAPLKEEPDLEDWDPNRLLNIEWTVKYYIKKGADPKKLVVGIPTYGRSYTLSDPEETDIGSPAEGPGEQGEATREKGYLAYYEICQLIQESDWDLEAPYPEIMGPFAYKDNQWVGFDDEDIIIEKVKFIVKEGLGGGMVWTLDNDDFRGKCYGEQSPLINTLKSALEEGPALLTQTTTTTAAPKRTTTQRASRRSKATSKPTKSTTPPPFTTPEPPQPFECEDEGFFNNPTDCKKYFWCLDSGPSNLGLVAHAFTCPSGLYFNKLRDSCDYASNVVCRVKKVTTTTTTTKPRPRPRTRKTTTRTTTTTTTTTTPKPSLKEIPKDIQNSLDELKVPLNSINMNGQNLMELLQLLQQLGVNQIQDKLHSRESVEATSTVNPTLPQYRSPNRRRTSAPETSTKADLFNQYAKPDRSSKNDGNDGEETQITVRPRGPQYRNSATAKEETNYDDLDDDEVSPTSSSDENSREGLDFPFVYHTPSRHRSLPTTEVEEVLEDYEDEPTTTTSTAKPTPANRRVVIKVRPIPGEAKRRNPPGTLLIPANRDKERQNRRNNYVLAQTVGVRRVARPNVLEEQTTKEEPTPKPSTRRARPITRAPSTTTTQGRRYRGPPAPKELMVLPTGRPAVPATTRRYTPYHLEPREPALALLPDGSITCLRRGVYPHPKDCAKFLVCVPAEQSDDEFDGFIHDCPKNTYFIDNKGRCAPGNKNSCSPEKSEDV